MNPLNILTLLGFDTNFLSVEETIIENETSFIIDCTLLEQEDSRKCPVCNKTHDVVIKDYQHSFVKHSFIKNNKPVLIRMKKKRFYCKKCKKTFIQKTNFVEKRMRVSNQTRWAIYDQFKELVSFSSIANDFSVSVPTVCEIFDSMVNIGRGALPKCLCIDEFKFEVTKYNKYPCVLSDFFSGKIIDIIESRKEAYLLEYFSKISQSELNKVKYFSSDLFEPYRTIKRKVLPDAIHIVDHFHVSKLFTNLVNTMRIRVMKTLSTNSAEYRFLKKYWHFFLANPEKAEYLLKEFIEKDGEIIDFKEKINRIIREYPELNEIYSLYLDFNKYIVYGKKPEEIKLNLIHLIERTEISKIKEILTLGNTLYSWFDEIVNSYSTINEFKISNSLAEANNNKIQKIIAVSYGLKSLERLKKRVLFIQSKKSGE